MDNHKFSSEHVHVIFILFLYSMKKTEQMSFPYLDKSPGKNRLRNAFLWFKI